MSGRRYLSQGCGVDVDAGVCVGVVVSELTASESTGSPKAGVIVSSTALASAKLIKNIITDSPAMLPLSARCSILLSKSRVLCCFL